MSKDTPYPELTSFRDCGEIGATGVLVLKNKHVNNMLFDKDDLACVYTQGPRVFYVQPDGKTIEAHYVDNGCDYFNEGLARGIVHERMVYFNNKLEIIIDTPYAMIFPFENGYAIVCNACKKMQVDEHTVFTTDKCGYINHKGQVIVPLEYSMKDLPSINQILK